MKKCKDCGIEEWGYASYLNEDGYCPSCARHHYKEKIDRLEGQLKYALTVLGQIAKLSDDKVDAVQCANAICVINEMGEK